MFVFAAGFFILKKGFAALTQAVSALQPERWVPTAEPRRCWGQLGHPVSTAWSPHSPGEGTTTQQPETSLEKPYSLIEGSCSWCRWLSLLLGADAFGEQALPRPQLPTVGGPTCTEVSIFLSQNAPRAGPEAVLSLNSVRFTHHSFIPPAQRPWLSSRDGGWESDRTRLVSAAQ